MNQMNVTLIYFESSAVDVRLDRRLVEDRDGHLRIRRLRTHLVVRITQRLANRIYADECARRQEVLALQGSSAHRVLLGPHGVRVLGEQLRRRQLVTRVAARRGLGIAKA